MKKWTKSIQINAPIEKVWELFNQSSLDNMQKLMPKVVSHKPVKETEQVVGSIYKQQYQEGKRIEEYDVETLDYVDESSNKKLKIGFTLANLFNITATYELIKIDDEKTLFTYTTTNQALKWYVKIMLFFANDKVVKKFIKRVKKLAEE
ncbi:hypothetical protein HNQ94_001800 [Salirhabdus euzebyi]|uniref:SRPBCC family protein n=1 Tax=Salirhabdus euzebyi TaxID=394506 RepID=A0A841Q4T1_9BACI|nr:SRPBCC family protein [Salirhabdus euzebyi]MBB6453352.1 hypothetical protein [Salirhabdus euzebyi]